MLLTKIRELLSKRIKFLTFIAIFMVFFIPRIIALGSDMANIDTLYWYPRLEKFPRELIEGDLKGTYQQYHPGTTMLWVSGFAKYSFEMAYEYKYGYKPTYIPHHFIKIQFVTTFPLVFLISVLGAINYLLIRKLSNAKLALIFSIILSIEPFFLGISKYIHLTALSSMFGFTGFLTFLYYLKFKGKKYLIFSGILQGLAIATKISLLVFHPAIGITALYYLMYVSKDKGYLKSFVEATKLTLINFVIAVATFFAISPYMWVAPIWGIKKIYKEGIVGTGFGGGMPDTFLNNSYLYYLETSFIRLTPIIFITFICGLILYFYRIKRESKNLLLTGILISLVIYYLSMSIPSKLKDRYLVEFMPMMLLFSAYSIYEIFKKLHNKKILVYSLVTVYFIYMAYTAYVYYPAYSFFHSELIGGPGGYHSKGLRPVNRGEWYAQAAQYLNFNGEGKPEEKQVIIGNESLTKSFAPFFYGTTYAELGAVPDNKGIKIHYIVTRNDNQKYVPQDICPLFKTFGTRGPMAFPNVFVFKCENILKDDLTKLIPTFPDY